MATCARRLPRIFASYISRTIETTSKMSSDYNQFHVSDKKIVDILVIINCSKCEIHFSTKEIIEEDDKRVAFSGVNEENV